jgi:hypothetical protein
MRTHVSPLRRPAVPATPRRVGATVLALLALCPAGGLRAQAADPIVTDRPDQTESAESVSGGHVQVEFGWRYASAGEDVVSHTLPDALFRVGLGSGLEARVGVGGLVVERTPEVGGGRAEESGFADASVGLKLELASGAGGNLALLADVSVPLGEAGFTSDRWDPAILLLASRPLGDRVSVGANAGVAWSSVPGAPGAGARTVAALPYSLALGVGLAERLGVFVEVFGGLGLSEGEPDTHSIDGGLTFLLGEAVQADVSVGLGLNDAAEDVFVGAGLAFRLPR